MSRLILLLSVSCGLVFPFSAQGQDPGEPLPAGAARGSIAARPAADLAGLGAAENSSPASEFPAPRATPSDSDRATSVLGPALRVAALPKSSPRLNSQAKENLRLAEIYLPEEAAEVADSGNLQPQAPTEGSLPESASQKPETAERVAKARKVLELYRPKMLNTRDHGPWETMHAIVAYGVDTQVRRGGPDGEPVTAIGWLAFNNPAYGQRLFYANRAGGVGALTGPGLQGHAGQFLAIMAQSRLSRDYPIQAGDKKFTIEDLIKFEQATCEPKSELTFKLISMAHYLDSDATWKSADGQEWSIPRLIKEEIAQPINGVTCGGSHRLFGLSSAVFQRARQGKPIVGEFARAKKFIEDYHKYTYALQNPDGSFSTEWFKGRGDKPDMDRKLQTTGHILEWLVFSTPRDQLENPQLTKAVDFLSNLMLENSSHSWAIGPRGHALHALAIYESRLLRPEPALVRTITNAEPAAQEASEETIEPTTKTEGAPAQEPASVMQRSQESKPAAVEASAPQQPQAGLFRQ